MKSTDAFKNTISKHLEGLALNDSLFAATLKKPNKNIEDCITYILNQVQKSGYNGFADEEIFGMAVHYYDENEIEVGKPVNMKVVVNHSVELSPDEMQEAKEKAKQNLIQNEMDKMKKKKAVPQKNEVPVQSQATLF